MSSEVSYQQQPSSHYEYPLAQQAPIMTVKDWTLTFILSAIPVVNIILLFVWAFGDGTNPNKKNYAKASLILAAIFIVLYVLALVLFFAVVGTSGFTEDLFSQI